MKIKFIKDLWYLATYRFVKPKLIVTRATFSGDKSFIDIRYWLSRPDRMNPKIYPYLVTSHNQKIGLMHFSKFGIMKSRSRAHTNTGILLFYNINKSVKTGDCVSLFWDDLKVVKIIIK